MTNGPALIDGSPERRQGCRFDQSGSAAGRADAGPDSDIRLTLPANPQNVVYIRHVVAELAAGQGLPQDVVDDVKLAVTEACTNVVRHAYDSEDGQLDVSVEPQDAELTITITDRGRGLRPSPNSDGCGLGLPLMAALASALEFEPAGEQGSRVRMSFRRAQ